MAEKSLYEKFKERQAAGKQAEKADKEAAQAPAKKPVRDVGMAEDIAKSLGSGVARVLPSIFGMGGDIELLSRMAAGAETRGAKKYTEEDIARMPSGMQKAIREAQARPMPEMTAPTTLPTSQEVFTGLERTILPEGTLTYQPKTRAGRVAQTTAEFAGGGAMGRAPIKGALMYGTAAGLPTGVLSEVDPTLGMAAGLVGGTTAGAIASRRRGVEKLLGDVVGEQTPQAIAEAKRFQERGRQIGVPLTAAESMEAPALRTLAASVAASPEGAGIISRQIASRQQAIPQAIERGILGIEEAPTELPATVQREAVEAAKGAVQRAQDIRTGKTTALYEAAKEQSLEAAPLAAIVKQAKEMKKTVGADTRAEIDRFINRITEVKTVNKKRVRVPITNVGRLESEYRAFRDRINLDPSKVADAPTKEASATLRGLNKQLDEALLSNENIAEARAIFKEATPEVVRVVDDSGLRAISALKADAEDTAINIVMGGNPSAQKIASLSKSLNAQDKTVMPKLAKRWMEVAADNAQKITTKGQVPLSSGVKFVKAVRGTPEGQAALNSLLDGVADAKGLDASQMKQGFNNMLDVLQRTNLIDAFGSPTQTRQATEAAIGESVGLLPKALQLELTAPTAKVGRALQRRSVSRSYQQIANAMVADDAVDAIMRLALLDPQSRKAQNIVANIINPAREIGQIVQPEQEVGGLLAE